MTKLREIVQINSGYTSYVDLYDEYYEIAKNRGRMERYKPITAHRKVFEKVSNALNPRDRRFYFLSGSYGTGKSHLLLMLANYFANQSNVPEIESFFQNYESAQKDVLLKANEQLLEKKASTLKDMRKDGRFLVAICRYSLNLDFEGALLRALESAIYKEQGDLTIDTHYQEALRRIKDWEERQNDTPFYIQFTSALKKLYPDWTIDDLVGGLKSYDADAIDTFKECYKQATDNDFSFKKDNLRDIISDFLKNPEFKKRYKGIVFLYDEFGAALDENLVNYTSLLDFAQYCANSTLDKGGTVIFIGAGHKTFTSHGKVGDLNGETLAARVTEIGLETQGMEDIIAAIVHVKKDSQIWEDEVAPQAGFFTNITTTCNLLRLFNWLPAPKVKNNIIQNIYPMHPLATYSLLRLASEAGSDNRSVLRFFAPEFETGEKGWKNVQPYSYPWFLENKSIQTNNKLNMYTTDLLADYFEESLKLSNSRLSERVQNIITNFETSLRELNTYIERKSKDQLFSEADEVMYRILKALMINDIASTKEVMIANTPQNIEFALNCFSKEDKDLLNNRLDYLSKANVIFNNNGVYELASTDRKEIRRIVDQFKNDPSNRPTNLLQSFLNVQSIRGNDYLEAKDYNSSYGEDKRMKVEFVSPSDLTKEYFAQLEQERKQIRPGINSYEGTAVYVFCENEADITHAKRAVVTNTEPRVSVAIPRSPTSVFDALFTLKALDSSAFKQRYERFTPPEKAEELQIRNEAKKLLEGIKDSYFNNTKVQWFGINGTEIPVNTGKPYDAANILMGKLFTEKRNTISHTEFNKIHINITPQIKRIFDEAADLLVNLSEPIEVNWEWPDNYGGKRYLQKIFANHSVLKVVSLQGSIRTLEPEPDKNKYRDYLPAYAKLLETIEALKGKEGTSFNQLVVPLYEEYGQGDIAVTLFLLLAKRLYGDGLRFKRDATDLTDIQFSNAGDMLSLVQRQYPSAIIIFEEVTQEDKEYFRVLSQNFAVEPAPAGKVYSISDAYTSIVSWWGQLPRISQTLDFYPKEIHSLAEAISSAKTKEPFGFIKTELPKLLGIIPGKALNQQKLAAIDENLKRFKLTAENIQLGIQQQILERVAEIFNAPSSVDLDIQEALKDWFTNLSATQKDYLANFHTSASRPLVQHNSYSDIRKLLFHTWPEAYNLGPIETWTNNRANNLTNLIESGKNRIEHNAPDLGRLDISYQDHPQVNGDNVTFTKKLGITAEVEGTQGTIYYTLDGSDPTVSGGERWILPKDKVLEVTGNRKIKFTIADDKGNYSTIKTINTINTLEKNKIIRPKLFEIDEQITFYFPKDKQEARITIHSLLDEIARTDIFEGDELNEEVLKVLSELEKRARS